MKFLSLLGLLIGMISTPTWAGPSVTAGVGDPRFYCAEQKAETYKVENDDSQWLLCVFDGVIDRYTLSMYKSGEPKLAVKAFFSKRKRPVAATEESVATFCKVSGGESILVKGDKGELRLCEFSDESSIEEWTLYYGFKSEKNKKLTENLSQRDE